MKNQQNSLKYRAYFIAVFSLLSSASVMAGLASGIATRGLTSATSKVIRNSISSHSPSSNSEGEFNSLSAAIPQGITDVQGKKAAFIINAVHRYRLGNSLPQDQRLSTAAFDKIKAEFSGGVSTNDKLYIRRVSNLHMFCQLEAELYILSLLKNAAVPPDYVSSESKSHANNMRKCTAHMKALPGIPSDFSISYIDVLKKYDTAEFKASLIGVKPGDSTSSSIKLLVEGMRGVRELMGNDLAVILN